MPEHAVIFGPAEAGNYSQAAIFGSFCIAINIFGSPEEINLEFGHSVIRRIEETILESPEITPMEITKMLADEFSGQWELNSVVAKIEGPKLIVTAIGNVQAKLIRQGKAINLLAQATTISGPIKENDILVLGSPTFFENLFTLDIFETREDLPRKLESLEEKSAVSGLVFRIDTIEEPEAEPVPIKTEESTLKTNLFLRRSIPSTLLPTQSKRTLYAVLLAFILLLSMIAFQLRSRNLEQRTKNEIAIEKQANDSIDSAKKLAGLNDNIARDILTQTKKDFLAHTQDAFGANWQKENSVESNKLLAIMANIDNTLGLVSHVYTLSNLDQFSDFSLLRANANITAGSLNKNEIVVMDGANGAVYSLGTKSKTAAIIGGGDDFKKESYVDFSGDNVYVFTPVNIYQISSLTNTIKILIKPSDKWGHIRGLKTFAGNIYLLDVTNNQIWKYQGTDLGFMDIAPYLKGGADFSNTVSFAIEGNIYVVSNTGNVAEFSGGGGQDFNITGLETPLKKPTGIFTSDETNNLYILDSGNNRVVVLDKKGLYQSQYLLPSTVTLSPLILADETVKKVFLFSQSKVYSFDLR